MSTLTVNQDNIKDIKKIVRDAGSKDIVRIDEGNYYDVDDFEIPSHVTVEGAGRRNSVLYAGKPVTKWDDEGDGVYSTRVFGKPAILTVGGKQVGQMSDDKMKSGSSKTFGYSGFDLLRSGKSVNIQTDWNGKGDFWKTLDGLWGHVDGKVYLRLKDKTAPKDVMIATSSSGITLNKSSKLQKLGLAMFEKAVDFDDDDGVLDSCNIVNGNKRVNLQDVGGCTIRNCDISMNFYGRRPNAWGGGPGEGELLWRFYKYFQGKSSSDDVSIEISNIKEGNRIHHTNIHDGAIGIRQLGASRRTSGPLEIMMCLIGHHCSSGIVWGFVNDDSLVKWNLFHNNNKQIRGWRLQLDGIRKFFFRENWYYNPKRVGETVYGHTTSNVKKTSRNISWNQSNETMVGGSDHFKWKNKIPPLGERTNNKLDNHDKPVYDLDREMDFTGKDKDYFDFSVIPNGERPGLLEDDIPIPDMPDMDDDDDGDEDVGGPRTWEVYETEDLIRADKEAKEGDIINIMGGGPQYGYIQYISGKGLTYNAVNNPVFKWKGHKAMRFAGSKSTFNLKGATFENEDKDTIKIIGYQLTFNDLTIKGGGRKNKLSAAILLRGSECVLNRPIVDGYYGDAIYCATDHLDQIISSVKVLDGVITNCGGAGIQFNPHVSGTMKGTHLIKNTHVANCGFNSKKAGFVVTEKVGADQLHDKVLFEDCTATKCPVVGFKVGRWGGAEVELLNTIAKECEIGYFVGYEGQGPVKMTNVQNVNNKRDFALNPKTTVIRQDPELPDDEEGEEDNTTETQPDPKDVIHVEDSKYMVIVEEK